MKMAHSATNTTLLVVDDDVAGVVFLFVCVFLSLSDHDDADLCEALRLHSFTMDHGKIMHATSAMTNTGKSGAASPGDLACSVVSSFSCPMNDARFAAASTQGKSNITTDNESMEPHERMTQKERNIAVIVVISRSRSRLKENGRRMRRGMKNEAPGIEAGSRQHATSPWGKLISQGLGMDPQKFS